jgi:anaphase-promoting complex subunit 4
LIFMNPSIPGSVSADFLELLLFGYPSEALDHFLTQELTEKELKKLGNSIELSYSTIQKLVVKPLHNAIVSLVYHINGINGMQQNTYYYKDLLGEVTNDAVINTGSFLIKSYELQHTIDKSMRDYKIFFRWLYIAITRLLDDSSTPDDIGTINQQEINYLAEFLYNFEQNREESVDDGGEKEVKFNLERVGQYLSDKDLIIPVQDSSSMWEELLSENECIRSNVAIYPHHKKLSLVQQKNLMRKSIDELFGRLETTVGGGFKLQPKNQFNDFKVAEESRNVVTSHAIDGESEAVSNMFTVLLSSDCLLLLICCENSPTQTFELQFRNIDECIVPNVGQLSFIDAKFYNSKIISILMKNQVEARSYTCFMQLSISRVTENSENHETFVPIDLYSLLDDATFKVLEGFSGMTLAVSGSRKVAAILAANSKVLRLYDMEVEDDDIEEDDSNLIDT